MATPDIELATNLAAATGAGMDRPAPAQPLVAGALAAASEARCRRRWRSLIAILAVVRMIAGAGGSTLRMPEAAAHPGHGGTGHFPRPHPAAGTRASRAKRCTSMRSTAAASTGCSSRPAIACSEGQPLIELSNTNLALSVIQQESQLNQAISQLQQNEIALEQNALSNDRALAEIEYQPRALERSSAAARRPRRERRARRTSSATRSPTNWPTTAACIPSRPRAASASRICATACCPTFIGSSPTCAAISMSCRAKLAGLIVRAPVEGRVTAIDLKVGEHRNPGERLAEVTPDSGMKLAADIDEFYLARVRTGQIGHRRSRRQVR